MPQPVLVTLDESSFEGPPDVLRGTSPDSVAWRELGDLDLDTLAPEGYALRISAGERGPRAVLAARDDLGLFRARTTLAALQASGAGSLPAVTIRDEPALKWRGTIEGFYGPPWSHADRIEHLRFCGRMKLNSYAYAPKDDPYHRERWREPYPAAELALLAELVRVAAENGVRFTYTIAPGLSMTYSSPAELQALCAKADQLWGIGVRSFALLFDDIPQELQHEEDRAAFGTADGATGAAHGRVCAEFADRFLAPRGGDRLVMVPTEYAGMERSPYRNRLAETLPVNALVWWTGHDIVVGDVTREHIDAAAAAFDRDLLLWDNFPVNDFDVKRLFLGPLTGRTTDVAGSRLVGISANPMVQAWSSQFALASVADWAWNPAAYEPGASAERAIAAVAGPLAGALRPLIDAASAWPPSAPRSPWLAAELSGALDGDAVSLEPLHLALAELVRLPQDLAGEHTPLVDELRPWLAAAAREAAIARDLAELLRTRRAPSEEERASLLDRVDGLAGYPQDVLRALLGGFVRTALGAAVPEAAAPEPVDNEGTGPAYPVTDTPGATPSYPVTGGGTGLPQP